MNSEAVSSIMTVPLPSCLNYSVFCKASKHFQIDWKKHTYECISCAAQWSNLKYFILSPIDILPNEKPMACDHNIQKCKQGLGQRGREPMRSVLYSQVAMRSAGFCPTTAHGGLGEHPVCPAGGWGWRVRSQILV